MKIVTDIQKLRKPVFDSKFTKEEEELASAALLTGIARTKALGLSANQIGLDKRICALNIRETPMILVNPRIVDYGDDLIYLEGCISFPKTLRKPLKTVRHYEVVVKADNYSEDLRFGTSKRDYKSGQELMEDIDLLEAITVQHLVDLLDGISIRDRQYTTTLVSDEWDKMGRNEKVMLKSPEGKTELIKKKKVDSFLEMGYEVV